LEPLLFDHKFLKLAITTFSTGYLTPLRRVKSHEYYDKAALFAAGDATLLGLRPVLVFPIATSMHCSAKSYAKFIKSGTQKAMEEDEKASLEDLDQVLSTWFKFPDSPTLKRYIEKYLAPEDEARQQCLTRCSLVYYLDQALRTYSSSLKG
jgi:hypothetical protein